MGAEERKKKRKMISIRQRCECVVCVCVVVAALSPKCHHLFLSSYGPPNDTHTKLTSSPKNPSHFLFFFKRNVGGKIRNGIFCLGPQKYLKGLNISIDAMIVWEWPAILIMNKAIRG